MLVSKTMKRAVISTSPQSTVLEAARLMIQKRVGTLPVVDTDNILTGVININDILDVFIPDYFDLIENLSFVHDFGALEDFLPKDVPEIADATVETLMKSPISVQENESILRAATKMVRHDLIDLPVINSNGQLVGLASHVDIGTAFLQNWIELTGLSI
jgi:CBS domain-containing protein